MSFFQRLRDVLGIDEGYEEYEDDLEDPEQVLAGQEEACPDRRSRYSPSNTSSRGSSNVIGLPGMGQMEVVLMQPRSFQEIPQAVNALRERKSVILDLTLMDTEQAQRSADYVAGGAYAIDGHQRHLGACVFLFTPSFVQISSYPGAESPVAKPPTASHTALPTAIPSILTRTSMKTGLKT